MDRQEHFGIDDHGGQGASWHRALLGKVTGLGDVIRVRETSRSIHDPFELADYTLRELNIGLRVTAPVGGGFPKAGPLIVIANHPSGAVDGLAAIAAIGQARTDLRVLANPELASIEGLRSVVIPVDPFGKPDTRRANATGLRAALRWVEQGGALLIFPAGEVAHLSLRRWSITDSEWHTTAARLIRRTKATVSPLYFSGRNSTLFQVAGLVHPRLRTVLLPSELARRAGTTIDARIGAPLTPRALAPFATDEALTAHLRLKTLLPTQAVANAEEPESADPDEMEPLIEAISCDVLAAEIAALPASATLVTQGDQRVICAPARALPNVLQELARLRELSFRAVGEGTGRSHDRDAFDDYYEHLFVWSTSKREIVGAYRLGRVDEIRRRFGSSGLYTSTLFEYREPFLKLLGPALELGRSFVRPEHQKSFAALLLLWKGIGEYIGRHPKYARLIGPVSISDSYSCISKELLVRYLRARSFDHFGAALVKAKTPFRQGRALRALGIDINTLPDLDAVSTQVAGIEEDRKGVPVLLRQYLKLGGRLLGFNVDGDFNDAIDCLLVIDLRHTDARMLRKYMSDDALMQFARAHRLKDLLDDADAA